MGTKQFRNLHSRVTRNLFSNILPFWQQYVVDNENDGFYGRISNERSVEIAAPKSLILITRILWTFSTVYAYRPEAKYLNLADRAYQYLTEKLLDKEYGGAYWMVNYKGMVIDNMKKMYGQAFTIYALCEYAAAANVPQALEKALEIFELIETHNYDQEYQGYFEAANRDWSIAEDMRLSAADMNEKKSMNTHLHLMEAYTNLYRHSKDVRVKKQLKGMIGNFLNHIIDAETFHFKLFFDEHWRCKSYGVSFGHDIEGGWLLTEAANLLGDGQLIERVRDVAMKMAEVTLAEGIDANGGIILERNGNGNLLADEFYWWPQAEAVVGFFNAWEITQDEKYYQAAVKIWNFIDQHFVDTIHGEWFYEV
ncbi:MAG: AGE family epimerase/isomerase, partial [Candidatus Marinimicrobia bacterium]|nr:AGE family epimerase/isomerase [Candidatus Neomarinimicrobiota bacterium]